MPGEQVAQHGQLVGRELAGAGLISVPLMPLAAPELRAADGVELHQPVCHPAALDRDGVPPGGALIGRLSRVQDPGIRLEAVGHHGRDTGAESAQPRGQPRRS